MLVVDIMRQERLLWQREAFAARTTQLFMRRVIIEWATEAFVIPPPLVDSDEELLASSDDDAVVVLSSGEDRWRPPPHYFGSW